MNLHEMPWGLVTFGLTQIGLLIGFGFWVKYSIQSLKSKVDAIEKENHDLKKQLQDMRDILVKVENNTHLLMLGRIKTGRQEA